MEKSTFGNRLRLARGRRGFTVEALAARANLSATAITNLENDKVNRPRIQTILALAAALNIEPAELLDPAEVA